MNELLLGHYLLKTNPDKRFRRWVLSNMVGNILFNALACLGGHGEARAVGVGVEAHIVVGLAHPGDERFEIIDGEN